MLHRPTSRFTRLESTSVMDPPHRAVQVLRYISPVTLLLYFASTSVVEACKVTPPGKLRHTKLRHTKLRHTKLRSIVRLIWLLVSCYVGPLPCPHLN